MGESSLLYSRMKNLFLSFCGVMYFGLVAQEHQIVLDLEEGSKFNVEVTIDQRISQTIMGIDQVMRQDQNLFAEYTVLNRDSGSHHMAMVYTQIAVSDSSVNGQNYFNSAEMEERGSSSVQEKMYAAMLGSEVLLTYDANGEVTHVAGVDSMIEKMANAVGLVGEAQKEEFRGLASRFISDDILKNQLGASFSKFPEYALRVGDTWESRDVVVSTVKLEVVMTYTVKEMDEDFIYLDLQGTLASDSEVPTDVNGMEIQFDIGGPMTGTIKIDKKTGWVMESIIVQDVEGDVHLLPTMDLPEGMSWPMQIDSQIKIQSEFTE